MRTVLCSQGPEYNLLTANVINVCVNNLNTVGAAYIDCTLFLLRPEKGGKYKVDEYKSEFSHSVGECCVSL